MRERMNAGQGDQPAPGAGRRSLDGHGDAGAGGAAAQVTPATPGLLAPRPPMGWNSWNSFATTITEAQARETAAIMREKLLPFGYDIFTVDIQWYEPNASSYEYSAKPMPAMDGYGRLIPAPNRFPSSADGSGFTKLAADVHAMGMKFGIHLMRGIPRLAVQRNLPILGTRYHASDIADMSSICSWNPDMYGVDMTKPGAQAYYDSVFRLYASWGVDFIKMDDMSRPYDAHAPEIEAAHRAIQNSGRPMMLSLSPGETPVIRATMSAGMRRCGVSPTISGMNGRCWRRSSRGWRIGTRGVGRGMARCRHAALGRLALGKRDTKFTPDEQRTLMTLWSIARSPLIMGGDLRHLDAPTLALLTNRAVIAVNQASTDNQPHLSRTARASGPPSPRARRMIAIWRCSTPATRRRRWGCRSAIWA
ncbi:Alpha-galactosidase A precursor [Sphingomonas paucimobilis]|nr:Alpha-galactosidase A precursor [Sphingomonas paucimobilis]